MRIAACGIACEVCVLYKNKVCSGCMPGTSEKAPERLEMLKGIGIFCPVLDCAIKSKQDYCPSCDQFPCDTHFRGFPYSAGFLNIFKGFLKRGS